LVIVRIGLGLTAPEGKTNAFISLRLEAGPRFSTSHKPEGAAKRTSIDGRHTTVHFAEPQDAEMALQTVGTVDSWHGDAYGSMS
jgi:hypothetical protein